MKRTSHLFRIENVFLLAGTKRKRKFLKFSLHNLRKGLALYHSSHQRKNSWIGIMIWTILQLTNITSKYKYINNSKTLLYTQSMKMIRNNSQKSTKQKRKRRQLLKPYIILDNHSAKSLLRNRSVSYRQFCRHSITLEHRRTSQLTR